MAKRPDLVIGVSSATDPVKAKEMERLGLKVVLVSVGNLNEIMNSMKSIAGLLGNEEAGKKLVVKINAQVLEVKKRVEPAPRRPVLLLVGIRPLIAVGGKNFIDELITLAGGANIAGPTNTWWPRRLESSLRRVWDLNGKRRRNAGQISSPFPR